MKFVAHSTFAKYEMTQEELRAGCHFSPEQRAVIQNLISDFAEEKISLKFTPNQIAEYQQTEAELQGKIGILQYLLSLESQLPEVN